MTETPVTDEKPRVRMNTSGEVTWMNDGYANIVAGVGQGLDKPSKGFYAAHTFSDMELLNAYETAFLPKRIVDTIAEDATRRWRMWNTDKNTISLLEKEEQRVGMLKTIERAIKHARLLGGAGVYFPIQGQNPSTPLDLESVTQGSLRKLIVFSQTELAEGELDDDFNSENYGNPRFYTLGLKNGNEVKIHHSRICRFVGDEYVIGQPKLANNWARSALQTVLQATKHTDGTISAIATLVLEARIDVINIKGLMQKIGMDRRYEQDLLKRFSIASASKSVNGTLILDELEQYQQKSQTYGSLPEIVDRFYQYVSGASGIPVTRLFGTSPGGLNATGEADIRHYYDRVQTLQNNDVTPAIHNLDECLIRSALGSRPEKIFYTWRSLWQVTEKDKAEVGRALTEMGEDMVKNGMIDSFSAGQAVTNALTEYEIMPGIEDAWETHLKVRSKPVDPVDLNKQQTRQQTRREEASSPRPSLRVVDQRIEDGKTAPLYIRRDVKNAKEIIGWYRGQGFETLYPESELHVTILYSKTPVDWFKMDGGYWSSEEELIIPAGGARAMEVFGEGTVVLEFASASLRWRHESLIEMGATSDYPEFRSHISITNNLGDVDLSNVKPYVGRIVLGPEIYEDINENWKSTIKET